MGELIRAEMQTVVEGFFPLIRAADAAIVEGNEWQQIISELHLKEHLLSVMQNAAVRALFNRIANCGMVELMNNPNPDNFAAVVGEACSKGLVPRGGEYGIFGGRGKASLFIKEAGYRKLINRLPGFSDAEAYVSFPAMAKLQNGASVWQMDGYASCKRRGELIEVRQEGKFAVSLPAHQTDNIDAIKTKGRRRMLKALYEKCTGIIIPDDGEDDMQPATAGVQVVESVAVQPALPQPQEAAQVSWSEEATQLGRRVSEASQRFLDDFFLMMGDCTAVDDLRTLYKQMQTAEKAQTGDKIDQRVIEFLGRYATARSKEIGG